MTSISLILFDATTVKSLDTTKAAAQKKQNAKNVGRMVLTTQNPHENNAQTAEEITRLAQDFVKRRKEKKVMKIKYIQDIFFSEA